MNKLIFKKILLIFILVIVIALIIGNISAAQTKVSDDELNKELKQIQENGQLSQNLIDKMPNLDVSQKEKIIDQISKLSDKQKFWDQWNSDQIKDKNSLLKGVSLIGRQTFFKEYGNHYGIKLNGFAENFDRGMAFGLGGIVGNSKFYFDSEQIKKQNEEGDPNKRITEVEYRVDGDKSTSVIKKQDGSSATIVSGKDMNGYFFDAKNSKLYALKESNGNLVPDEKSPFSGDWNGRGSLSIDISGKDKKMSLDFVRDKSGKADDTNFAKFTNSNGDSYSTFLKPTGKKDSEGSPIYERNKAEISFNSDGKASVVSNAFYDGSKYSGYLGKDVNMFYNKDDYTKLSDTDKAKLGSYLIVDEKNKFIGGDIARTPGGPIPGTAEYAKGLQDYWAGKISEMDKAVKGIDTLIGLDSKQEDAAKVDAEQKKQNTGWFDSLTQKAKDTANSIADAGKATAEAVGKEYAKGEIAKTLGLSKDNPIVQALSTNAGLRTIEASLAYAKSYASIAEDLASFASSGATALSDNVDSPLLKSMLPADGSFMNIQLKNDFAKEIQNVNLRGGSLDVEDSNGKLVRVVDLATTYSYRLNSNLNLDNPSFEGINFNLINGNSGQLVNVYSDSSGNLEVRSKISDNLQNVGSQSFTGEGTAYLGPRGGIKVSRSTDILSISMEADSANIDAWQTKKAELNSQYAKAYSDAQKDGFSPQEIRDLDEMAASINIARYQQLASGDLKLSLSALSEQSGEGIEQGISGLASKLQSYSKGSSSGSGGVNIEDTTIRDLTAVAVSDVISDKSMQDQLVQRGLTSRGAIETAIKQEAGKLGGFLEQNPGVKVEYVANPSNGIYQVRVTGEDSSVKTYNLDPAIAGGVRTIIPALAGSVGVRDDGTLYISADYSGGRFNGEKSVTFSGSTYHRLIGARKAQSSMEANIRGQIEGQLRNYIRNPDS